ncbi:MAG TPA: PSD1 and planctomycete cytochrome C domain-containing protein [Verrucomicrobiales bacterium]|nr:PSD1 and planctomycete cytochrome C domain-containing protein [Verrucomicrobiales bacterium]
MKPADHIFRCSGKFRLLGWASALGLLAVCPLPLPAAEGPGGEDASAGAVDFNRDIRPILSENCFHCHGPDSASRKAELRLDLSEVAGAPREGGAALVPGDPESSLIFQRITASDPGDLMPPPKSEKTLTPQQIDVLRRWIAEGGQYQPHWSFVPPSHPKPPPLPGESWPPSDIDRFVLARLRAAGLPPGPEADRRTLIRRVTLDLTGLPPSSEEIAAFLADESPEAYERLVDRLLDSPRYGEHMARYWLDAARYGDTHGLHLDNYREIWPYRDWVIRAFNENKPYSEFTVEQLAGDLLPEPNREQLVATGYNRCNVTTSEGGSIEEEVRVRNVVDRAETFGTVFLGLTIGCAVCHDHKFDPISQKEFYQFTAFFNNIDGSPLDGNAKDHAPVIPFPTPEQEEQLAAVEREIDSLKSSIAEFVAAFPYQEPIDSEAPPLPREARQTVWIEDGLPAQAAPSGPWDWVASPGPVFSGERAHRQTASGIDQHFFQNAQPPLVLAEGDKFFAHVYLDPENPPRQIMLQWNDGDWNHRAFWGEDLIPWGDPGTPSRFPAGDLPETGKWVRLEVEAAQVGLNPKAAVHGWAFTQFDGQVYWDQAGVTGAAATPPYHSLRVWIEDARAQEEPEVPGEVLAALRADPGSRSASQQDLLRAHFLEHISADTRDRIGPLHQQMAAAKEKRKEIQGSIPTTLIWRERQDPMPAFVLQRGEYDQRGEEVGRGLPAFLPPLPEGASLDRLGLAQWLLQPGHPLTARVAVNRFWQQLFGTGLVKTAEDFGSQGEPPSHPALLDWLANDFIANGWNIKRLMKQLVLSAAYRQSSHITPEALAKDRENRLISRGARYRLDAEVLRDQALYLGGLLVEQTGGPGVKPPQPAGLWEAVGYTGSNTARFSPDTGPGKIFRRSVYTFWKRTAPPPPMSTFDAPSRESCSVRRERTNTPLQALLLMNEPQFFESARSLAEGLLRAGHGEDSAAIDAAFQHVTGRLPGEDERSVVFAALADHRAEFQQDPAAAARLLASGANPADAALPPPELAAWTMIANLLLNLAETINKN